MSANEVNISKNLAQAYIDILRPPRAQYDYDNQAWIVDGVYRTCGHRPELPCDCYGRLHAGERAPNIH